MGKEEEEVGGKVSQIFSSAPRDWRKEDGGLELLAYVKAVWERTARI